MDQKTVNKLVRKISGNRMKILDEFCKAYLSSFSMKDFEFLKDRNFKDIKLVVQEHWEGEKYKQEFSFQLNDKFFDPTKND